MTNIQAAIGLAQLEKISTFLEKKRKIFNTYNDAIERMEDRELIPIPGYSASNHWLNVVNYTPVDRPIDLRMEVERFNTAGIEIRPMWMPNHLQKPYRKAYRYRIENAEEMARSCICLPSSSHLSDDELERVINCLDG